VLESLDDRGASIETVVKLGGGVLAHREDFEAALTSVAAAGRIHRLLVVPGGGPFADTVRDVDRRLGLPDSAAHWMAVLAMDQYAYLIAARLLGAVVVTEPRQVAAALSTRQVPVLAPSRWLQTADPLPHTWSVTSDSIAAWVAGRVGARRLVLIKPPGATVNSVVDSYFPRALPSHVTPLIVPADQREALRAALRGGVERG
jgi:aspartokinase-like uncharacterized kinase